MLRDNSITVYISHRVHGFGSFVSVCLARKREGDEDGRTPRVKEEDTCDGGGGGEEREKIDGGTKTGVSYISADGGECVGFVRHLPRANDGLINGTAKSGGEKSAIAKCREHRSVFLFL